ncbi:phosphatase domain-containing protein [Erythrobacter alti]|uniref:phosphatase domain-containing protein n=1 Tax=Erythrobacter alti TaxID=1896145 RepID=UPI0030F3719F
MVLSRKVSTRLQPYFGYRSAQRMVLSARALRSAPGAFGEGSRWKALRTMVAQFASREVEGVEVRLVVNGPEGVLLDHAATTDREGFVHFDIALSPDWDLPKHPAWEVVQLHWLNSQGPQCADAYVLVPGRSSTLAVISDIDDTIIETGITGSPRKIARNWKRVFAQLPHERIAVPEADTFFGALGGGAVTAEGDLHGERLMPATHRPFFYISSSPWNLFSYLVAFQRLKGLPLGPLMLRDWGFNRQTLGGSSHGAHKEAAIASILTMYPEMQFALIGDDTQGDLPAFAHAIEAHPGRIAAIFLRQAAGEEFTPEEQVAKAAIEKSGVPLWLGETYAQGVDFLQQLGFTPGGETEQIVRTVEEVETAKEAASGESPAR